MASTEGGQRGVLDLANDPGNPDLDEPVIECPRAWPHVVDYRKACRSSASGSGSRTRTTKFPGKDGGYGDGSRVRRRFEAARDRAALSPLRFHDLRHTFGSLAIDRASLVQVQAWMGHSDLQTTMRYLHYKNRGDEAAKRGPAFRVSDPAASALQAPAMHTAAAAFHTEQSRSRET